MITQPYHDAYILYDIPEYHIHVDVGENASTYMTWKSYQYFILFDGNAIYITWVRFMIKKSDILSVFCDLIIIFERHYNIRVCVKYNDFGEFNEDVATKYFSYTGIICEPSAPNVQQQNRILERYMQSVIKGARA